MQPVCDDVAMRFRPFAREWDDAFERVERQRHPNTRKYHDEQRVDVVPERRPRASYRSDREEGKNDPTQSCLEVCARAHEGGECTKMGERRILIAFENASQGN